MGDYKKTMKTIKSKSKLLRFKKNNIPKKRDHGLSQAVCRICGKKGMGVIQKYNLNYCRRCFREYAKSIGFKKYN